jgi:hypothetical protein
LPLPPPFPPPLPPPFPPMLIVGPGEGGRDDDGGRDVGGCCVGVWLGVVDGGAELCVGLGGGAEDDGGALVRLGVALGVKDGCGLWSLLRAGTLAGGGNCTTGRSSSVSRMTWVQVRVG